MVTSTHGDAQMVQEGTHVHVVYLAHQETNNSVLVGSAAKDAHARNGAQALHGVARQVVFVLVDVVHA